MDRDQLIDQLHDAIHRLADAVDDMPELAAALRRFAERIAWPCQLSAPPPRPAGPPPEVRTLLYHALDDGVLDAQRFDQGMILGRRAERLLGRQPADPTPSSSR